MTKKQPVAVAGTVTALASVTISLGMGFTWWQLNEAQNASLMTVVTALVAVISALIARNYVQASETKPRERKHVTEACRRTVGIPADLIPGWAAGLGRSGQPKVPGGNNESSGRLPYYLCTGLRSWD